MPIGRLFVELAGDSSGLDKTLKQALDNVKQFDVSVKQTGQRFIASFQDMINPTNKMVDQLKLLQMAGYSNQTIWKAMGDQFQTAAAQAKKFGQEVDPAIKRFMESAQGAGSGIKDLGQAIINFAQNPIQTMRAGITAIAERLGPLAVGFLGVGAAIATGATAIYKFVSAASDAYEQLENLSIMTGESVNTLKALRQVADEAGFEGLDLGRSLFYINQQLAETGKAGDLQKGMDALGISVRDANDNIKNALTIIDELGGAIANQTDPIRQASDLAAVFGVRYRELGAFAVKMQGHIRETTAEIEKSGNAYSKAGAQMLKDMDAAKDSTSRYFEALKNSWVTSLGEIWGGIKYLAAKLEALPAGMKRILGLMTGAQPIEIPWQINQPPVPGAGEQAELVGPPDPGLATRIRAIEERTKSMTEAAKKAAEELSKIHAAELKYLQDQLRAEEKVKDQVAFYADEVEKAAAAWAKNVAELKRMDPLMDAATNWAKSWLAVAQMKPRPLFEEAPLGQTFEDFKNNLPKINQEIDTFVTKNEKASQSIADIWRNQISTIVTDWSRGIADILIEGGDFGKKLTDIFKETAKSILRILVETLFNPLKNWLSSILGGLFGLTKGGGGSSTGILASLGGIGGTMGMALSGGLLAGTLIPSTASGKILGGIAGGLGGTAVAGGMTGIAAGAGLGGFMTGAASIMAAIPVWGWAALGAIAISTILYKAFTHNTFDAGALEVARDMGGTKVGESTVKTFFTGLGLTDKQAYGIRKDLLFSPAFISQIAVPAAQSQGRLDALLKSMEKVTVDSKIAASGYLNFRAVVEEGIKTGNWDAFNKAYEAAFKNSAALTAVMPDFASKLLATADAAQEVADATTELSDGWQGLLDAIRGDMGALDDMYATFYKTGEILPQLAADIQKYGGNLAVFQKYASLGGLRENIAAIGDLISGLNQIMPDLGPIESILQGKGINAAQWMQLQAMNIDPSKLVPIADLIGFEANWEESVKQFQDAGKLISGSVLQQALARFGGAAGATALERYGQGFNTITPGLLDATKAAMDIAYRTERQTAVDYLKTVQTGMESEIKSAGDAIVIELQKILAAIELGFSAREPNSAAAIGAAPGRENGGPTIIVNGPVYGYDDFDYRVQQAWNAGYRRGAFGYAVP